GHSGDAGNYLEWLCLHGTDGTGQWVLWLEGGEIHGGTVGGFQWRSVSATAGFDKRCSLLSKANGEITLPVSLRLGTTESEVLRTLGKPTLRQGDKLLFVHEHNETIQGEPYTSTNALSIIIRHGVVWAMETWKTTAS